MMDRKITEPLLDEESTLSFYQKVDFMTALLSKIAADISYLGCFWSVQNR